jgi:HK97 family phage major capsid protein
MPITAEERQEIVEMVTEGIRDSGALDPIRNFTPGATGDEGGAIAPTPTDEQFKSFGEQMLAVARVETQHQLDPRLTKATGLGEGVPSEGGFLVQQEFVNTLVERVYQESMLAARCFRQPVGGPFNGVKLPRVDETSRADGSRWGGVRAYWASEGGTKTASTPQFGQLSLELEKLIGLCYVTDELLQDSVGLDAYIKKWFTLEFGFKLDDALINGDGSGKPRGVITAPCTVSVAKESGQDAATVVFENITKMWARMWARSRPNAVWYINQDIEPQLDSMSLAVGTGGVPVYMPANGIADSPYGRLKGRPVIPIEQCPTLGTVGDIILADFSQYMLIEKGGMDFASSIHVQFATDETAFRFVYRVNGLPMWASALTPFKGTNTQSPFITLATRS